MKYKRIGTNNYKALPMKTLAKNRGIESLNGLINYSEDNVDSPFIIKNMREGVDLLVKSMKNDEKIRLIIDSDVDGSTSSALLYLYLCKVYDKNKISWLNHSGKKHGIIIEEMGDFDFDVLLIADAGSSDYEQHKILKEMGKKVVVCDHHEAERYSDDAVVINPKMDSSPNKELSGVSVAYKFCKAIDEAYNMNHADYFLDLVAVGMVSDLMDTTVLENRYYIMEGLSNVNNLFLKHLINYYGNKIKSFQMDSISFYIAPLINAVHRMGTLEEKNLLFKCLIDENSIVFNSNPFSNKSKKKGFIKPNSFIESQIPKLMDIKKAQDDIKNELLESNRSEIESKLRDKVISLVIPIERRSFTGLLANSIASEYNKPTFVVVENKDGIGFSGSGRNFSNSPIEDLREKCDSMASVNWARGHASAFGININNSSDLQDFVNSMNEELESSVEGKVYEVDFEIQAKDLKSDFMSVVGRHEQHYGKGFEAPCICVKDIIVDKSHILYNEAKTMVKFQINDSKDILAISFKNVEKTVLDLDEAFLNSDKLSINIIGRVNINEWAGKTFYQLIIDEYDFVCYNKRKTEFWF